MLAVFISSILLAFSPPRDLPCTVIGVNEDATVVLVDRRGSEHVRRIRGLAFTHKHSLDALAAMLPPGAVVRARLYSDGTADVRGRYGCVRTNMIGAGHARP